MRIFLAGVSCVGKSSVGLRLSEMLDYDFCDLDVEMEKFYEKPVRRLQEIWSLSTYLRKMAVVLEKALQRADNIVVALPPQGLTGAMWRMVDWLDDSTIILLKDSPENIVNRIIFYDDDSNRIYKVLNEEEKVYYLREIRRDIAQYKRSYRRADMCIDIAGCDVETATRKVRKHVDAVMPMGVC